MKDNQITPPQRPKRDWNKMLTAMDRGKRGMFCRGCGDWFEIPRPLPGKRYQCERCGVITYVFAEWGGWGGSLPKRFSEAERQRRRERLALARRKRW